LHGRRRRSRTWLKRRNSAADGKTQKIALESDLSICHDAVLLYDRLRKPRRRLQRRREIIQKGIQLPRRRMSQQPKTIPCKDHVIL